LPRQPGEPIDVIRRMKMRAEMNSVVEDIKQSVGLLRRAL
jgi:hypothetical protein